MKLIDIAIKGSEYHWWQFLIHTSYENLLGSGLDLIRSIDRNAPDNRVLVCVSDQERFQDAHDALSALIDIRSTHIVLCEPGPGLALQKENTRKYRVIQELLELSRLPILCLEADCVVTEELSLLPIHLKKGDAAIKLVEGQEAGADVEALDVVWFRANDPAHVLLGRTIAQLEAGATDITAFKAALLECRGFLKLSPLPEYYCDASCAELSYIWCRVCRSPEHQAAAAKFAELPNSQPDTIVFAPRQDLGTKSNLADNTYKRRTDRLSRPGRIFWRFAPRLIAHMAERAGASPLIVTVPQWEITEAFLDRYPQVECFYVPHRMRKQLDHPKARFYMQEFLPMLFTTDQNGWGASSSAYLNEQYLDVEINPKTQQLIDEIRSTGLTKAPQKQGTLDSGQTFDLLAPLQVPNDDALVYHSDTSLQHYVEALYAFAEAEKVKVLIRRHPFDHTDFFKTCKARFTSDYVVFGDGGHIHDDIRRSKAVAVINSGVGFEAMMLGRPVVSFGHAVYDSVLFSASALGLAEAYKRTIEEPEEVRAERYTRFISWYVYKFGLKLDEQALNFAKDRMGAPEPADNPFFSRLTFELNSPLNGIKTVRVHREKPLQRAAAQLAYRRKRNQKLLKRGANLLSKRVLDKANSQVKKAFMTPFEPSSLEGKRVALVGNASSLRNARHGDLIDSFDVVVRMNLGYPLITRKNIDPDRIPKEWIHGTFVDQKSSERDHLLVLKPDTPQDIAAEFTHVEALGRKTTIWSCSTSDRARQTFFKPLFNAETVACHPNYHHLGFGVLRTPALSRLPEDVVYDLRQRLGVEPTSGLIWAEFLAASGLESLTLFGFDFFTSGHITRRSRNMLQVTGKWPHDPLAERAYIEDLAHRSNGRIEIKTNG
ncbi:glycosyltransferase family 29 protein [Roseibium aggregatum]|uniref:glycosyltransferase family 29 protein n=1 Tax=Roseibium aggregatum TaxID=187304 RepID=UPI003A986374